VPAISVVIPTYNWSAALRCAIRSVLLQTMQDFEILVVGDGCTDDSEAVTAAFNDTRIRWKNLDHNYGSQWAANNYAVEHARSDWIAYLGHDDIWYPTHLAAVLNAALRNSADIVTSAMILYPPPGTNGRAFAGVFATGAFSPGDFVPPSAFAHAKSIYRKDVRWRDPEELVLPIDAAFLEDIAATGGTFASTHELTCFKFNAAWRRDAYKIKSVAEQELMLQRIDSGIDFRQSELLGVLQAVAAGQCFPILAPPEVGVEKGFYVRRNRRFKGLDRRYDPTSLQRIEKQTRFDLSQQDVMPFEWYGLETHPVHGVFRWTGPSVSATIDLPIVVDRDLHIMIHVLTTMRCDSVEGIKLSIHEQPLDVQIRRTGETFLL
jgi:glycosyltransferase involved in cell wall biosynthesis